MHEACLHWLQDEYISIPTHQNLKSYIGVLIGFKHIFSPGNLNNNLLSQGYVLETAPSVGKVGRLYIPKAGKEVLFVQVQLMGQLVVTSSQ